MLPQIFKNVLFGLQPIYRAVIYLVITILLSAFCDFSNNSESYFAQQDNILNIYFVKFSWGWTLMLLGAYLFARIYESHEKETDLNVKIKHLLKTTARLCIATAVWYYGTGFFLIVEEYSGVCDIPKYLNKNNCKENGYLWKGFDISGHCFLLVWCNLVIMEEVHCILDWENRRNTHKQSSDIDVNGASHKNSWMVRLLFYLLCCVTMLWDIMIICTNMFFHSTTEKIIGTSIAVSSWFALYQLLYKMYLNKYLGLKMKIRS